MSGIVEIEAMLEQAGRLGLLPRYRYGTVAANSGSNAAILMVTLDGDDQPSRVFNVAGSMPVGTRVFTVSVAPHGVYAIGAATVMPREQYRRQTVATSLLSLTVTPTVVAGTSITIDDIPAGALYKVEVSVDFQSLGTTATAGVCQAYIDGVAASTQNALFNNGGSATARATTSQTFTNFDGNITGTTLTAGSHTFALFGFRSGGADGQMRVNNLHTTMTVTIYF